MTFMCLGLEFYIYELIAMFLVSNLYIFFVFIEYVLLNRWYQTYIFKFK